MRHKHIGTLLGAAIQELVDADKAFEAEIAKPRALSRSEMLRLHRHVADARAKLLHFLAQEAISDEERAALGAQAT